DVIRTPAKPMMSTLVPISDLRMIPPPIAADKTRRRIVNHRRDVSATTTSIPLDRAAPGLRSLLWLAPRCSSSIVGGRHPNVTRGEQDWPTGGRHHVPSVPPVDCRRLHLLACGRGHSRRRRAVGTGTRTENAERRTPNAGRRPC